MKVKTPALDVAVIETVGFDDGETGITETRIATFESRTDAAQLLQALINVYGLKIVSYQSDDKNNGLSELLAVVSRPGLSFRVVENCFG